MAGCACADRWRIEVADLRTGIVKGVIHPLSFDFEERLSGFGQGSMTLATKDIDALSIWPHLTSVYFSRVSGGSATPLAPVAEGGLYVEAFSAGDSGTTQVGLQPIEDYANHRMLNTRWEFNQVAQTEIAKALIDHIRETNGIPLYAIAVPSSRYRDRTYEVWDRKIVGEALTDLSQVIEGLDWTMRHEKIDGAWRSTMIFVDRAGADRGVLLRSDREAMGYGLDVDARDHATYVDAIGAGEEKDQLVAHAEDTAGIYPRFDASPAWTDVSRIETLQAHADGYIEDYREPIAIPSAALRGFDPDPAQIALGDTVTADINYGAATYKGKARVLSISWSSTTDEADTRVLDLQPLERASLSVLTQNATENCEDC